MAQRKALLRCLVDKVVLDRGEHDVASVRIVWRGGAVTELAIQRRVNAVTKLARGEEMRDRALTLARAGMYDDQIAAVLTSERGIVLPTARERGPPDHGSANPACRRHSGERATHPMVARRRCADRARNGCKAEHPGKLALRADQEGTTLSGSSTERGLPLQ